MSEKLNNLIQQLENNIKGTPLLMPNEIEKGVMITCEACKEKLLVHETRVEAQEIKDSNKIYYKFDFKCYYVGCGHNNKDMIVKESDIREIKSCKACNRDYIPKNIGKTAQKSLYCHSRCRVRAHRRYTAFNKRKSLKTL